ncbi:50S ribosomal protein L18 [Patescibacteria group bacterium]|nr:50S ribosomal protein L18 [Patescibacteria group bacterium]
MNKQKIKTQKQQRRKARVRAQIFGTATKPRLSVFRSLKNISAQLIDDEKGKTLASANDKKLDKKEIEKLRNEGIENKNNNNLTNKVLIAYQVGKILAEKAMAKKIKTCVFDKSGYKYHGRVKAIAEGARKAGLKF